jgi:hypothetical protein
MFCRAPAGAGTFEPAQRSRGSTARLDGTPCRQATHTAGQRGCARASAMGAATPAPFPAAAPLARSGRPSAAAAAVRGRPRRRGRLAAREPPEPSREDDPTLQFFATAYGMGLDDVPPVIEALAAGRRAAAAAAAASPDAASLFGARCGSALGLHELVTGAGGAPRDRAIKMAAALCDMAAQELLSSWEW